MLRIEPDQEFIQDLSRYGGETSKRCFQCATCSMVCSLAPPERPFPRKEMLWAQWGLSSRLLADPDVWLCHRCNDCSLRCPRGARPGDVLSAVRRAVVVRYSVPRSLAWAVNNPHLLPLMLVAPFLLLAALLWNEGTLAIPDGRIVFAKFAEHMLVEVLFMAVSAWALIALVVGGRRYWRAIQDGPMGVQGLRFGAGVWPALRDILWHKRFRECDADRGRSLAHVLVFAGFFALAATAGLAAVGQKAFGILPPLDQVNPVKVLGNLGALLLLSGGTVLVWRRIRSDPGAGTSTYFDWLFLGVLFLVGVTGLASELVRLAGSTAAYGVYFVHLGLVLFLLGFAPYSKFAHLWYRTIAMVHAAARRPAARAAAATRDDQPRAAA